MQERRSRWQHEAPQGNAFTIYADRVFTHPPVIEQENQEADTDSASDQIQQSSNALAGTTLWSMLATNKPLEATFPFSFTDAQRRVICEIFADVSFRIEKVILCKTT